MHWPAYARHIGQRLSEEGSPAELNCNTEK
jgi:hypothetical protein